MIIVWGLFMPISLLLGGEPQLIFSGFVIYFIIQAFLALWLSNVVWFTCTVDNTSSMNLLHQCSCRESWKDVLVFHSPTPSSIKKKKKEDEN